MCAEFIIHIVFRFPPFLSAIMFPNGSNRKKRRTATTVRRFLSLADLPISFPAPLSVVLQFPPVRRRNMIDVFELLVEESQVVIPNLLGDFAHRQVGIA